jgi:hypothetical protein
MYPKNVDGLILTGDYKGWFIMIEPLSPDFDTYLILYATIPPSLNAFQLPCIGYDDWAADEESIASNLKYRGIEVQWLSQDEVWDWIEHYLGTGSTQAVKP